MGKKNNLKSEIEEDALKKMVRMQEEENKKQNKKLLIIPIILVGVVVLSIIGFIVFNMLQSKKPISEEWGQTYYVYLKDMQEKSIKEKIPDDAKMSFVDVKDVENPVMVVNYEFKEKNYTNVYYIQENKVNAIVYQDPTEIEFLYNISNQEYNYYLHTESDEQDYYGSLTNQIDKVGTNDENDESYEYVFTKNKIEVTKDSEGNEISVSEKDKVFIETEVQMNEVEYDEDFSDKELKEAIESTILEYKPQEKLVTDELKEDTEKKIEELNKNMELIEKTSLENVFNDLKGVWYEKENSTSFEVSIKNGKKYFCLGWFASEAVILGDIKDIKYEGKNVYEIIVKDIVSGKDQSVLVDLTNINNKKVVLNNTTYSYVAKDMDKAYEKLLY